MAKATHTCAKVGSIVLPIKDNGMFEFIKAYSIATKAHDIFVGLNLSESQGMYSDGSQFDESIFDFGGASVKFSSHPCVYLKKGIFFQARGSACHKEYQFYCIWKGNHIEKEKIVVKNYNTFITHNVC